MYVDYVLIQEYTHICCKYPITTNIDGVSTENEVYLIRCPKILFVYKKYNNMIPHTENQVA